MILFNFLFFIFFYFIIEIGYFKVSTYFGILDKPNERSSHTNFTIRGGGVIFPLAVLVELLFFNFNQPFFAFSLFVISVLSFIDDVKNINSLIRLLIQCICVVGLLFPFYNYFNWEGLLVTFILVTGIINAYNFMDGINGITVLYSSITIMCLFWISENIVLLQSVSFFISLIASFIVFAFFNFRKKAKTFAGDVGSVSVAFIICYLLLKLIIETNHVYWIFFLTIYGIDTTFTIICRILRKESILKAHRSHFYQYLVNEKKYGHLSVSLMYGIIQILLNLVIVQGYIKEKNSITLLLVLLIVIIYIIFRLRLEGSKRLFVSYNPD